MNNTLAKFITTGIATAAFLTQADELKVYFGTYTSASSKGIYLSRLNTKTGALSTPELAAETKNPSFLALNSKGTRLYTVSEIWGSEAKPSGGAAGFDILPETGKLRLINEQSVGGSGPCHLVLDQTDKQLFVANYGSGSVSALPVDTDGRLGTATVIQHEGSSLNPRRQAGPHAHQAVVSPDNRFLLVPDLGLDKVLIYKIGRPGTKPEPHTPPSASVKPGAGPRHLAFSPDARFFYVINELDSTMTAFAWDAAAGTCSEVQTLSTLPADFSGTNHCAEVVMHPTGKFVYGSNRGHDSIAIFKSDRNTGKLEPAGHVSSGGKFPRNIALDPSGKWLLSLNQNSGNVIVLRVNDQTGLLSGPVAEVQLGSPVCAVFVR